MRGGLRIKLSIFGESITFKTKAKLDNSNSESIEQAADDLRKQLCAPGFFEGMLRRLDTEKAWNDILREMES